MVVNLNSQSNEIHKNMVRITANAVKFRLP